MLGRFLNFSCEFFKNNVTYKNFKYKGVLISSKPRPVPRIMKILLCHSNEEYFIKSDQVRLHVTKSIQSCELKIEKNQNCENRKIGTSENHQVALYEKVKR